MNESYEVYSLKLEHYIENKDGRHAIDEPLVVRMAYDRLYTLMPICVNHMLDEMRREVLRRTANDRRI